MGNGPGELSGWIIPVARSCRALADGALIRLVLVLYPSQFASGGEAAVAASTNLFDEIIPPRECLRLAVGLARYAVDPPTALIHLGGDLWFSRRLARRWGVRPVAFAETPMIADRARAFEEIYVPNERVARELISRGVASQRIHVVGDPRLDTTPARAPATGSGPPAVTFFAGSRARLLDPLFGYWVEAAAHFRSLRPRDRITIAASTMLPADRLEDVARPYRDVMERERIALRRAPAAEILAETTLAVTIPGTLTMEIAALPLAALVVAPLRLVDAMPVEGIAEWLLRIPGLGRPLKRFLARLIVPRVRHVALPNRLTGRPILPELIGDVSPSQVAESAAALMADERRRKEIEDRLIEAVGPRGGSMRIAERLLRRVGAAGSRSRAAAWTPTSA